MLVFVGTLMHSTWEEPLQILNNTAIGVQGDKIVFISPAADIGELKRQYHFSTEDIQELPAGEFLVPGFVDTHIHASQHVNAGKAMDLPLLEWLDKYTFPTEASHADLKFAKESYNAVVRRVLKHGTTTACYFATIDVDATLELCRIVSQYGQRALVGKVCMNQNSPRDYTENTEESLSSTNRFLKEVNSLNDPLVMPVVTPRFAVSCDEELLAALGTVAADNNLHIQSHVSENRSEVEMIKELFPHCANYTDVYMKAGLLTSKTIMAHGVWLSDSELEMFKENGAAVSHCPNSNISIRSGLCDVRNILNHGVKVGLGTDISGGYAPSVMDAMRMAVNTSKVLAINKDSGYKFLDHKEAFRLATLGGSQALSLDDVIGNFVVGKHFDALRICPSSPDSPLDIFDTDTQEDIFQKFIFNGDDRNIMEVYVAGNKVMDRASTEPTPKYCNGCL